MIHSAPIPLDNLASSDEEGTPIIEFNSFSHLYESGYPVERVIEAHSVVNKKTDDEDSGHIVLKIETLQKPITEADVAVDGGFEKYVCDCKGFQHHYSVDLEEKRIASWGACPHIESVDPSIKATNDPKQSQLE